MVHSAENQARIDAIYNFWFGSRQPECPDKTRNQLWFTGGEKVDAEIKRLFGPMVEEAIAGRLDVLAEIPQGRLALIILLDQFTRNIFRRSTAAFSGDDRALKLCIEGLALGHHESLSAVELTFFYLPLEHSENLAHQERCIHLFHRLHEGLEPDSEEAAYVLNSLKYVESHRDIIKRFGRFPHRNAVLGRVSSEAEASYLEKSGRRFGQ